MNEPTAIIETMMSQLVAEGRELHAALVRSERDAAVQRVLMGRFLVQARKKLPARARSASEGWGAFLEAIEMDPETARRYMVLAEATLNLSMSDSGDVGKIPSYEQLGLTKREGAQPPSDVPDPGDDDRPLEDTADRDEDGTLETSAEPEIDRNTWCTPKEWAERLGQWDLDPCGNERSHIEAVRELRLDERGEDGLFFANQFDSETRAFINPPYARGQVIQWVNAYAHTRFCFLLKFDPSTDWFAELMRHTAVVMIPRGERIEFEPPVGVPPEKAVGVQFPHAFFYAREADISDEMRAACFPAWRVR